MSFIELPGLGDIQEQRLADENVYPLIINNAEGYTKESTGNYVIRLTIAFEGEPDLQSFRHWLSFPGPEDDKEKVKDKVRRIRRFLELTGVAFDPNGIDEDDFVGATFEGRVTKETMTDSEGNEMIGEDGAPRMANRLIVPRFKSE